MALTAIHPQLLFDTHFLGTLGDSRLLLHRNAVVPWFILVPDSAIGDLLDVPSGMLSTIMEEAALISRFVKETFGCAKVNFASIGNVVPQLHLHIVGRSANDPCWPAPVWGNLRDTREYGAGELARGSSSSSAIICRVDFRPDQRAPTNAAVTNASIKAASSNKGRITAQKNLRP